MRKWVCSARPLLKWMTMCLPKGSMAVTSAPITRAICGPGWRARAASTVRPTSRGRSAAAVLKIVSPSGTPSLWMRFESWERDDAFVAALDVQGGLAVYQDDVGTCYALHLFGPRQTGAVGV